MPACFKSSFLKAGVIIDCTEFLIERPSSCRSQSITFSNYKNHNTAKGLLGISPNGYPAFVSNFYAGRTRDKKITNDCGILKLPEPGDDLMAHRGFDVEDDLPTGVTLNIPPFLSGKPTTLCRRRNHYKKNCIGPGACGKSNLSNKELLYFKPGNSN